MSILLSAEPPPPFPGKCSSSCDLNVNFHFVTDHIIYCCVTDYLTLLTQFLWVRDPEMA